MALCCCWLLILFVYLYKPILSNDMSQKIYDVFISYSHKNVLIVDKVCAALDREGISYFIDRHDFGENDNVPKELMDKITESKIFLLIASENSYGSDYIINQIHHAYCNTSMVTYVIDGALLPLEIDDMFGFMEWYNIDEHPIDTIFMDELRMMLGYGYRKSVLTDRERFLLGLPDDEFVRVEESTPNGNRYGYMLKSTGEIVVPIRYNRCDEHFHDGLARVRDSRNYGFVNKIGDEVVPLKYYDAKSFREGLAVVYTETGASFVDKTGRVVTPHTFTIAESCREGLALVMSSKEGMFGFINNKGETTIPFKYNDASSFHEGLARAQLQFKGKYGFIDKNDEAVIPFQYDEARSFSEGLAAVSIGGLWGYIDKDGKEVIPIRLEYDTVFIFRGGLACVKSGGKYGFINNKGKEVIPVIYEFSIYITAIGFMNGETCRVKLNDEYFWIDKNGNRVDESTQKYWDDKIPLCELGKLSIFVETE